jgi:formate transporter
VLWLKNDNSSFIIRFYTCGILQREATLERILWERIYNLMNHYGAPEKYSLNVDSLKRSLFEVQMLAKQLYPTNEKLKEVLTSQGWFNGGQYFADNEGAINIEMIRSRAKEIALTIGLIFPTNDRGTNNKEFKFSGSDGTIKEPARVMSSSESSDSLSPQETAEKVAKTELQKVKTNALSTFILSILAGAFIALGGIYFTFATSQKLVTLPFTQILGGIVFSMGLMFVVITGAQLFTSNNLGIMNLASRKISPIILLGNWVIVYIGNAIGAVATAAVLYMSNMWTNNGYQFGIRALAVSSHKVSLGFVDAFFLGILCNCFGCLAIWLAASGKKVSDKILAIIFPISAFVAMGFEHSVANMYFLSFGLMIKNNPLLLSTMQTAGITVDTSHLDYVGIFSNLLPVTLGNIVGGSVFVGLVYWLAFLRNKKEESSKKW